MNNEGDGVCDGVKSKETQCDIEESPIDNPSNKQPIIKNKKETSEKPISDSGATVKPDRIKSVASGSSSKRCLVFPKTLQEFGYHFVGDELQHIETKEKFKFEVHKDDKEYNQKHYEAIGEIITEKVYELLETRGNLKRLTVPIDSKPNKPSSFIYASDDALINEDKVMIIIHGSGVVRAGQWSRRLIINDNLRSGTQLPFINRAMEEGYGVIVTNTNRNFEEVDGKKLKIKGSETPENHALYVWEHFILSAKARHIYIVAHSYGGVVTVELMKKYFEDFKKRVVKIAFTDSAHNLDLHGLKQPMRRWITNNSVNWVTSPKKLDAPLPERRNHVLEVSAGTLKHEETSFYSFESIFKYFSTQ